MAAELFKKFRAFLLQFIQVYLFLTEEFLKGHTRKYAFARYFAASRRPGQADRSAATIPNRPGTWNHPCFRARGRRYADGGRLRYSGCASRAGVCGSLSPVLRG